MTRENFDVIVIGGGPAGVAAAVELKRNGVDKVVILDREQRLGGATRHCSHSPFGMLEFGRIYLGAGYGRRLERESEKYGVEVRCGYSVTRLCDTGAVETTSSRGVEILAAERILVATGARETPRSARLLPGDRPLGIVTTGAFQSYTAFHGLLPFSRPIIVGSELVSLSALLTCLTRGIRPVAMIERGPHPLAKRPFTWFPALVGVPLYQNAQIIDIIGTDRVSAVLIRLEDRELLLNCDGILLTGQFTPESVLCRTTKVAVDPGSGGPAIDQHGRTANPIIYSAGNILRGVETGGWSYREGRAVGAAISCDLSSPRILGDPVRVAYDDPLKLVVPTMLRRSERVEDAAFKQFQLRFVRRTRGTLSLALDDKVVWKRRGLWLPERRVLVPIPRAAPTSSSVRFHFESEV
jgi:thioredoxin reductase